MTAPPLHCGKPFDGLATNDVGEWMPVLLHEGGLIPMELRIKHLSYFKRKSKCVPPKFENPQPPCFTAYGSRCPTIARIHDITNIVAEIGACCQGICFD